MFTLLLLLLAAAEKSLFWTVVQFETICCVLLFWSSCVSSAAAGHLVYVRRSHWTNEKDSASYIQVVKHPDEGIAPKRVQIKKISQR